MRSYYESHSGICAGFKEEDSKKVRSHLDKLLEDAYYFGLHPYEVEKLTVAEMVDFIRASRRRQLDDWRVLANVGYNAGLLGSMALSKRRPKFDDMFSFPKESEPIADAEKSKAQMLVWASQMNREYRKAMKEKEAMKDG